MLKDGHSRATGVLYSARRRFLSIMAFPTNNHTDRETVWEKHPFRPEWIVADSDRGMSALAR